jgi:hypothetical protein
MVPVTSRTVTTSIERHRRQRDSLEVLFSQANTESLGQYGGNVIRLT